MTNQKGWRQRLPWDRLQSGRRSPAQAHQFLREIHGHRADEFIPVKKYLFSEFGGNICWSLARRPVRCHGNQRLALAPRRENP
jgi:hypothetical protein